MLESCFGAVDLVDLFQFSECNVSVELSFYSFPSWYRNLQHLTHNIKEIENTR